MIVRNYSKNKQPIVQKHLPNCRSCRRKIWLQFDKGYYCKNCEDIINKQKHQIDRNVLRQERVFSTRLNYANKKIGETWMNLLSTNFNSTEDMINKEQQLKRKTK